MHMMFFIFKGFGAIAAEISWGAVFFITGALYLTTGAYIPKVTEIEPGTHEPFSWSHYAVFKERRMLAVVIFFFLKSLGNCKSFI